MKAIEKLKTKFKNKILAVKEETAGRIYLDMIPDDIRELAQAAYNEFKLRLITASGTDSRSGIEIIYHFADDSDGDVISFRTAIKDKKNPSIESLTPIFRAAEWIEREMHELLGVNFIGHPKLKHLLLAEDWPEGDYPLRHDNERK